MQKLLTFMLVFTYLSLATAANNSALKADLIVVIKSSETLWLVKNGKPIKRYEISLGPKKYGHKQFEGDGRTPEGFYRIVHKNQDSQYYKSLLISYPNKNDRKRAKSQGQSPGGQIMIHGLKNGLEWVGTTHRYWNWTQGCIAVTNEEIDEIWDLVDIGTRIFIYP